MNPKQVYKAVNYYPKALTKSRRPEYVKQRVFISMILRQYDYTFKSIAEFLGMNDHTSIMYYEYIFGMKRKDEKYQLEFKMFKLQFESLAKLGIVTGKLYS